MQYYISKTTTPLNVKTVLVLERKFKSVSFMVILREIKIKIDLPHSLFSRHSYIIIVSDTPLKN